MLNKFLLHQLVLSTAQIALGLTEFVLAIEQILHLPKPDVIIIFVYQTMTEERHQQLIIISQIVFFQVMNETDLRIVVEKRLQFLT